MNLTWNVVTNIQMTNEMMLTPPLTDGLYVMMRPAGVLQETELLMVGLIAALRIPARDVLMR